MVRPEYAQVNKNEQQTTHKNLTAAERAEALRTEIYSLASNMPKQQNPSLATQMSASISKITELLYMNEDAFINQGNAEKREVLHEGIKAEIKMLSLLTQLALERGNIDRTQYDEIAQKITECKQILFFNAFQ